jgi:hypothetical protein
MFGKVAIDMPADFDIPLLGLNHNPVHVYLLAGLYATNVTSYQVPSPLYIPSGRAFPLPCAFKKAVF